MGFTLNRVYVLNFSGDLQGLEVKIGATSAATVMKLREAKDAGELASLLASHVREWNLEDSAGALVPITAEAILQQEEVLIAALAREWHKAAIGVSAPLDLRTAEEVESSLSLPMELPTA